MTQALRQLPGVAIVPFRFMQDAVAASQTDVQLPVAELFGTDSGSATVTVTSSLVGVTMPCAGEVLYVVADTSVAGTDGSLTAGATFGGTEDADTRVTLVDAEVSGIKAVTRNTAVFAAGAVLGCEITTDGDWDAVTADLLVTIYVALWL